MRVDAPGRSEKGIREDGVLIPYAKLIGAGAVVLALSFATYKVYDAGRDSVQAKWDAERAVQQAALDAATAETARIDAERVKLTEEIQNDLRPKLDATESANRDLARRLLNYSSRPRSALPEIPGSPGDTDSTSRIGSDESNPGNRVGEALNNHLAACDRDAIRLNGFIQWYTLMRDSVP